MMRVRARAGSGWQRRIALLPIIAMGAVVVLADGVAHAWQLPAAPLPVDPTPLSELVTPEERTQIAKAAGLGKVMETYLMIADKYLDAAVNAVDRNDYRFAERALDTYNKSVSEAANHAFSAGKGKRGVAKKMELRLYKHIKILETLELRFPVDRLGFAEASHEHAKRLRVRALNQAFDSGEILKTAAPDPEQEQTASKPKGAVFQFKTGNPTSPSIQLPGDYLNEEEDDKVRGSQAIDERVKVFMKIAERRLAALSNSPPPDPADKKAQKKAEEELREWGSLPKVSRTELLQHYARAISECIAKLEDAHERNPKSSAIPKALMLLRDATDNHLQMLRSIETQIAAEGESVAFRRALDEAKRANEGAREGLK